MTAVELTLHKPKATAWGEDGARAASYGHYGEAGGARTAPPAEGKGASLGEEKGRWQSTGSDSSLQNRLTALQRDFSTGHPILSRLFTLQHSSACFHLPATQTCSLFLHAGFSLAYGSFSIPVFTLAPVLCCTRHSVPLHSSVCRSKFCSGKGRLPPPPPSWGVSLTVEMGTIFTVGGSPQGAVGAVGNQPKGYHQGSLFCRGNLQGWGAPLGPAKQQESWAAPSSLQSSSGTAQGLAETSTQGQQQAALLGSGPFCSCSELEQMQFPQPVMIRPVPGISLPAPTPPTLHCRFICL